MSRKYSAVGPSASGTANKTALALRSSTTIRQAVYGAGVGPYIAPNATDFGYVAAIGRFTAQGTSAASAPTPLPQDLGDVASLTTVEWTDSAEPTYATSNLCWLPGNQRSAPQWGNYDGREMWSAATASNGIGIYLLQTTPSTTFQIAATLFWGE